MSVYSQNSRRTFSEVIKKMIDFFCLTSSCSFSVNLCVCVQQVTISCSSRQKRVNSRPFMPTVTTENRKSKLIRRGQYESYKKGVPVRAFARGQSLFLNFLQNFLFCNNQSTNVAATHTHTHTVQTSILNEKPKNMKSY